MYTKSEQKGCPDSVKDYPDDRLENKEGKKFCVFLDAFA
jgi:hypothetical protein